MGPGHTRIIATTACYPPRQCGMVSDGAWSQASSPPGWPAHAATRLPPHPVRTPPLRPSRLVRSRSVIWHRSSRCPAPTGSSTASPAIEVARPSSSRGLLTRSQRVERPNAAHSVRVGIGSARSTSRTSVSASILRKRTRPSRSLLGWTILSSAIRRGQSRTLMASSTRINRSRPGGRSTSVPTDGSPISTSA
jgi:hypothetical protein